jgi:hypothetical protein
VLKIDDSSPVGSPSWLPPGPLPPSSGELMLAAAGREGTLLGCLG